MANLHISHEHLIHDLSLALALTPRASLEGLSKRVGTSKASLYRLYGSRDQLVHAVNQHCALIFQRLIINAELTNCDPLTGMRSLISSHIAHGKQLTYFLLQSRKHQSDPAQQEEEWSYYWSELDNFFLRCQIQGCLRINIAAPEISELFTSLLFSVIQSERKGFIAPKDSAKIAENLFMHGATQKI
jgi:TetR/AcrR family transcriptional regulator, mexCD-oprJ operon repressor